MSKILQKNRAGPKYNFKECWKDDENLLCKRKQCKFNVYYLGSVGIEGQKPEVLYLKAMTSLLENKKRAGVLGISIYSLVLQDKNTNTLILDQTLKRVIHCATYSAVPYSFYYVAEDPSSNINRFYAFISCKEVSERIVNAIEYAMQIFGEQQQGIPKLQEISQSSQVESDTKFKQGSLAEKYRDPQSSIVIQNTTLKCSKTLPDFISIPRPRGSIAKETSAINGRKLSQEDMFKSSDGISKSLEVKSDLSTNDQLQEIFNVKPMDSDRAKEEKLQQIHRINEAFHKSNVQGFEDSFVSPRNVSNGRETKSRYDSFKNLNSEGAFGWSPEVGKNIATAQSSTKPPNTYLDDLIISEFFHTNPFNSPNNFSSKH